MRNYLVYIKAEVSGRMPARARMQSPQAYVTPCFSVDKLFWEEQESRRLFVIGSSTSLALAFAIREQINRQVSKSGGAFTEAVVDELRGMVSGLVNETNRLYGQHVAVEASSPSAAEAYFSVSPWNQPQYESSETSAYPSRQSNTLTMTHNQLIKEAAQLYGQISGRALFLDEIERLSEKQGQPVSFMQEALQWLVLQEKTEIYPGIGLELRKGIVRHTLTYRCQRCGSERHILLCTCHTCGQGCAYCTACLDMGRSKCCTPYVCTAMPKHDNRAVNESGASPLQWSGQFSPAQSFAAEHARRFVASGNQSRRFLIWAVCGAGKTELIFPAINETLAKGGQVLVATPRKDVVLELAPRLARVFPTTKVIAVHGSSLEKWKDAQLVISTTHQVMRYYRRFDLVVVDEVDAFPFRGDEMLYRAVERAAADEGKRLFLSATPPRELTRKLVRKKFFQIAPSSATHVMLPLRYHGHLLPVPQVVQERQLERKLRTGVRMESLLGAAADTLDADRQLFLFVPRIEWIEHVVDYMVRFLPAADGIVAGVYAADPEREKKVMLFREKRLRLIVTTTILERGVTIPRSDVIVLGADDGVFDEASLVQIAGRVGRSADAPDGMVRFITAGSSRVPHAAVKQIKRMNRLGMSVRKEQVNHG